MAGYLTNAMILIETEKWLRNLESALNAKRERLQASGGSLPELEAAILQRCSQARRYLNAEVSPSASLPAAEIENGVGQGISKYSLVGAIGPDFPIAANILALNQRWVGHTMHKGSPRRALINAGTTSFVFNFIDHITVRSPSPEEKRALMAYLMGHLVNVATSVIINPFLRQVVWSQDEPDAWLFNHHLVAVALDAALAQGYFQRNDLHDGQGWEHYFLDKSTFSSSRVADHFLEAFRLTYGGTTPREAMCAADECRFPPLNKEFLVDGYANTVNWAINQGYNAGSAWFEWMWFAFVFAGMALVILLAWLNIQSDADDWEENGFLESERAWFICLDSACSWSGLIFKPLALLAGGFFGWDGIFGQGTIGLFERPAWHWLVKLFNQIYPLVVFVFDTTYSGDWDGVWLHPGFRWPRLGLGILTEFYEWIGINKGSLEEGREGEELPYHIWWPLKIEVLGTYFLGAALAFTINGALKDDDGRRKTSFSGWDFVTGLAVAAAGGALFIWGVRHFEKSLIEKTTGARWPRKSTELVSPYLSVTTSDSRKQLTAAGRTALPVRLFSLDGQEAYPQAEDATTSWDSKAQKDEEARQAASMTSPSPHHQLKTLLDQAVCFGGLLAIGAVNYDEVTGTAAKERTKLIFKDWNLDYRTRREWDELMDTATDRPGLLTAAKQWLLDMDTGTSSNRTTMRQIAQVVGETTIAVRLRGRLFDAHPFAANVPEPLPDVLVRGWQASTNTNDTGEYTLESLFRSGVQNLEIGRSGVDNLTLELTVTGLPDGPVTIVVRDPETNTEHAQVTQPAPIHATTLVDVALPDLRLVVHKVRGTVSWPDSRAINNRNYQGTPLAGKRVYAVSLAEGEITPQRPANSRAWAALKDRPDVHRSGRPGRYVQSERTDANGAFEIKFIDLSVNRRYFVWVESLDPVTNVESPEYMVRTFYAELRELTGSQANQAVNVGRHLIDHTYNLTDDAVIRSVESFKIVNWTLDDGGVEVRAIRPQRDAKNAYETLVASGERLELDSVTKLLNNYRLHCLPLVPAFETFDAQSEHARATVAGLMEAMDQAFPHGHFAQEVRFVLDARHIDQAINLSTGNWDGAWNPANVNASQQRRLCELLEKTFVVSPQIPNAHIARVEDVRWRFDAITLADYALISIPQPPPVNQAVIANRRLDADWVPVLHPVTPRLTGLSAGRHLFLAPGHGFFDGNSPSNNLPSWRSQRGGYNFRAGEDENDGYMAAEVNRIVRRQGMQVTNVREVEDFTAPGVVHPANNVFNPSPDRDFLRLWQQNPMYYLGQLGHPVVVGPASNLGQLAGDHNDKGIETRWRLAHAAAAGANPIHILLAIHTNAGGGGARGASAIYLDVATAVGNNVEVNTVGEAFATRLRDQIVNMCHINRRQVVSVRQLGNPIADLQRTFDHWTRAQAGTSALWPRVRNAPAPPAGWQPRPFPITIPAALVEVAFHDNTEDAALLSRAWLRRLAGEAMSFAVEQQLRAEPAPITRADMVRLLLATFGPSARIRGLVANNTPIAGDVAAYVQTATGEAVLAAGANLDAAVNAVGTGRNRYSRQRYVGEIRDALANRAGYPATAAADIEQFVTANIVSGRTLDNMSRPNAPVSRAEAATLLATALGWSPAALVTVTSRQIEVVVNNVTQRFTLMEQLEGAEHPEKYVPAVEGQEIVTRIGRLTPEMIYRVTALYLADEAHNRLAPAGGSPVHYIVPAGRRITIIADTGGVPWHSSLNGLRFTISNESGFSHSLAGGLRTRQRLGSVPWQNTLPEGDPEPVIYTLTISVTHPTLGERTLKSLPIRILVEQSRNV